MIKKFCETGSGKGLIGGVLRFWSWQLCWPLPAVSGSPAVPFIPIWPQGDLESNSEQVWENFYLFWRLAVATVQRRPEVGLLLRRLDFLLRRGQGSYG